MDEHGRCSGGRSLTFDYRYSVLTSGLPIQIRLTLALLRFEKFFSAFAAAFALAKG
jgi:hypothetical protein